VIILSKYDKYKKKPESKSKSVYEKIKNIGIKYGIIGKEISNIPPDLDHVLGLRFNKRPITCIFPKNEDFLILEHTITISPEHIPIYLGKSEEVRKEFKRSFIKFALLNNYIHAFKLDKPPLFFNIRTRIFFEGFKKPLFMEKFEKIGNAGIYIVFLFEDIILGEMPKSKGKSNLYS
jgi:hypothetical protein